MNFLGQGDQCLKNCKNGGFSVKRDFFISTKSDIQNFFSQKNRTRSDHFFSFSRGHTSDKTLKFEAGKNLLQNR